MPNLSPKSLGLVLASSLALFVDQGYAMQLQVDGYSALEQAFAPSLLETDLSQQNEMENFLEALSHLDEPDTDDDTYSHLFSDTEAVLLDAATEACISSEDCSVPFDDEDIQFGPIEGEEDDVDENNPALLHYTYEFVQELPDEDEDDEMEGMDETEDTLDGGDALDYAMDEADAAFMQEQADALFFKKIGRAFKKAGKSIGNAAKKVGKAVASPFKGRSKYKQACWVFRKCESGLSCQPIIQRCYHSPRRIGEPCSLGFGCGTLGPYKLQLFCKPLKHVCSRDHQCSFLGAKDGRLNRDRIKEEDRMVELKQEMSKVMATMKYLVARRIKPKATTFRRLRRLETALARTQSNIKSLQRKANKTVCGVIVKGLIKVGDIILKAIQEIGAFLEKHKCFLVSAAFSVAGIVLDKILAAVAGGTLVAIQDNPVCIKATSKVAVSGILKDKTNQDVLGKMAAVVQKGACYIRDSFGVSPQIVSTICRRLDAVAGVMNIVINMFCAKFGSALTQIISFIVQCAIKCSNGFCPK